ncbi:MAG: radical SAM protein [Tannerellaceae bacterium]|nr:radical SAM protein [Tannerellaceae bacterium]
MKNNTSIKEYLPRAIIEVTSQCNLKCRHCYNWWKIENAEERFQNSYQKAFRLIDHLIKHTTLQHFTFTGGEPTISERFSELVLHAKIHHKKVTIISNGYGPEKIYDDLIRMQINMMEFSIHSVYPEVHDRITGIPGSWEKVVNRMDKMLHAGITVVPVTVITSFNHQDIKDTLQFFQNKGIQVAMVNRYNIGGEGLNQARRLSADIQSLRKAFHTAIEVAEIKQLRVVSDVCTPHCILNPTDYPAIRFGSCSDNQYQRPLTFDLEGNLRLCNHSPVNAGNIYKESLSHIFSSDYINDWSQLNIPFCRSCEKLRNCKAGCRAASEQTGLSLNHEDPIVKELGGYPFEPYVQDKIRLSQ